MRHRPATWWTSVCGLGTVLAACHGGEAERRTPEAVVIDVALAQRQDVPVLVSTVGTLEAMNAAEIRAEVEGRVTDIVAAEGARVRAGATLLRIDPERYRVGRQRAAAQLAQAVAQAQNDSILLERNRPLLAAGAIGPQTLEDVQTRAELSRAGRDAARAALSLADRDLRRATVTAPFTGEFVSRLVDLGDYVKIGDPVGRLVAADTLRLTFQLAETEGVAIRRGAPVSFEVTALPGRSFTGLVYYVSPAVEERTRTIAVKAWVPNPDGTLRPGLSATVRVQTDVLKDAVVVPDVAIRRQGDLTYLFKVAGGEAQRVEVRTATRPNPGAVVVLSGVAAGDSIVVAGFQKIEQGRAVRARVAEMAPADSGRSTDTSATAGPGGD